jgi:uncharacterized protein (TIGR03437 family)
VALCTIAHAAGARFAVVLGGSGQDYAASVASDASGNTYIAGLTYSPDFPVTPGAFQTIIGGNGTLANPDSIASDAFVAKFGPDGALLWSTFLGGSADDYATGVGVDASGNVVVTGWTRSLDFPVLNAVQATNHGDWDAFVAKLDPTGSKLVYSTYLGGPSADGAYALALDGSGNAYVTGQVSGAAGFTGFSSSASGFGMFVSKLNPQGALVYSFFQPNVTFAALGGAAAIAVDSAGSAYVTGTASAAFPIVPTQSFGPQGTTQALVFKLAPDGSKTLYVTTLGGSVDAGGMAIAVDSTGAAYVGGITTSIDFPLVHPVQSTLGARPLWSSTNGSATWAPIDNLPFAFLQTLLADPTTPSTLYAGTTDRGLFKSTNAGVTWNNIGTGIAGNIIQVLAIDPAQPQTLYAATGPGVTPGVVYKSGNGGSNWSAVDSSSAGEALQVAIDAQNPNNIYVVWSNQITRKSTDAGATWSNLPFPGTSITSLALDPRVSGNIYTYSAAIPVIPGFGIGGPPPTGTPPYIYHSTDGGATWTQILSPSPASPGWIIDGSTSPSTVYNGLADRSTDNGATWTMLPASVVNGGDTNAVAVDAGGTLYAAVYNAGIYASHDHGQTWALIGSPVPVSTASGQFVNIVGIVPVGTAGTLYAILQNYQNSAFVTKLSPDGSSMVFSTLLNGHQSLEAVEDYAAEPGVFLTQNWISGIALDFSDNVIVAGGTRAADFPTANPEQSANAGYADAFVATLAADGSKWTYSTYYGGSHDDSALGVTVDAQGNVVFAGQTWSPDFPVSGNAPPHYGYGHAFAVKLTPASPPAIASVLNGASFLPGIEAGSWVTIKGSNLANTTRTWAAADFDGANLPTSLSGVSVTVDGQPAFVEYISPTQINLQAPADATLGTVNVVVDNNGALSAPATAQLQTFAPAFFEALPATYVIASRLPGYAAVGTPSAPATPGDTLVLWGTGFGPTTPSAAAGTIVSGTPVATTPTVTVGGVAVPVLNVLLTPGTAGLYQITIQLPANVPTGAVAIQASVGGAQTQAGATIFVAGQ